MNLSDYIRAMTPRAFAERYKISPRTVEAWTYARRRPRPEQAEIIVDSSPVTWEGIYRPGGEKKSVIRAHAPKVKLKRKRTARK